MEFSPLTILHVSTELGWQGGEQQACYLAEGLRQRGHRSIIFARRGGDFARRMRQEHFQVLTFRRRGRGPDALLAIRKLVNVLQPDILHAHDGHALSAGGLAILGFRKPLCIASRRVIFPIRSRAKFCHLADGVVAISRAVIETCREGGIPEGMLRLVHSGVDPERVARGNRGRGRKVLNISDQDLLLLSVASLTACKGHAHLLDSLPQVFEQFPRARMVLVGEGELKQDLQNQANRLGIGGRVQFLGYRRDISDLLCAADLFVMPSLQEGLCTSLLDAMFAKIPIVTTWAGGIADVVDFDSSTGPCAYVVPPGQSSSLSSAIIRALSDPDRSRQLTEEARKRARQYFTHHQMVEGTLSVYREWLTSAAKRSA